MFSKCFEINKVPKKFCKYYYIIYKRKKNHRVEKYKKTASLKFNIIQFYLMYCIYLIIYYINNLKLYITTNGVLRII